MRLDYSTLYLWLTHFWISAGIYPYYIRISEPARGFVRHLCARLHIRSRLTHDLMTMLICRQLNTQATAWGTLVKLRNR